MSRYNYFRNQTVDGYAFPSTPQITFGFLSRGFSVVNLSTTSTLQYSFDGYRLHGDLVPGSAYASLVFDNRLEDKMWWRGLDGYGVVRVEAWGEWGRAS